MRILHTSDWHIGRRLGRHDRSQELREALDEVSSVASQNEVDLILIAGDLFDRPAPPVDALALGLEALEQLAQHAPVVAIAGNHDSPELFDALAPFLRHQGRGIHLVGGIRRPEEGGIIGPDQLGVPAVVACFPFLREGKVVDFMAQTGEWYGQYADRISRVCASYNQALVKAAGTELLPILLAHFMVGGVKVGGSERELHIGEAYSATAQAIPPGPQYVALGHIHAPQPVPSSPVPAQYAGSLLPLDFGEAGETKRVVLVDAQPGELATVSSVPLASGRPLVKAEGTWDQLEARAEELRDCYLDLTIKVGGPDPEMGRRAAETFPFLVNVRPLRPATAQRARPDASSRPTDHQQYSAFYEVSEGQPPSPEALALFRGVLEEALDASS